jgi:hypothetical protein
VRLKGVLCIVAGHRLAPADEHDAVLLLRCSRCGYEAVRSAETFEAEGFSGYARAELADELYFDPSKHDPRIQQRRR